MSIHNVSRAIFASFVIASLSGPVGAAIIPRAAFDANVGVFTSAGPPPTMTGDDVGTWTDLAVADGSNDATGVPGVRPSYTFSYAGSGENAVTNSGSQRITLASALITGDGGVGFTIKSRAFIFPNAGEHVFVDNWHQTNNTSGIEFREFGGQIGIYVGYANTTVSIPQQVYPAIGTGGFYNVLASRVGNLYTVGIDLNNDGDMNDIVSGVSESGAGLVGTGLEVIGSGHNLEIGNIYYNSGAPSAITSLSITVPEPASACGLIGVGLAGMVWRRRRARVA